MNATAPTKPVMDVALPKRPVSAPRRAALAKMASAAPPATSLVRRRPLTPMLRAKAAKAAPVKRVLQQQPPPAAWARHAQQPAPAPAPAAGRPERRVPVALITATIFVMLILSVLAVAAFVTFRMA